MMDKYTDAMVSMIIFLLAPALFALWALKLFGVE